MSLLWRKNYPIPFMGRRGQPYAKYKRALRDDPCSYCPAAGFGFDHITPRSKGGANTFHNLTGACEQCNSRKADRPLLIFMLEDLTRRERLAELPQAA